MNECGEEAMDFKEKLRQMEEILLVYYQFCQQLGNRYFSKRIGKSPPTASCQSAESRSLRAAGRVRLFSSDIQRISAFFIVQAVFQAASKLLIIWQFLAAAECKRILRVIIQFILNKTSHSSLLLRLFEKINKYMYMCVYIYIKRTRELVQIFMELRNTSHLILKCTIYNKLMVENQKHFLQDKLLQLSESVDYFCITITIPNKVNTKNILMNKFNQKHALIFLTNFWNYQLSEWQCLPYFRLLSFQFFVFHYFIIL